MDKYIVKLLKNFTWKYGELCVFNTFAYSNVPVNNLPLQMLEYYWISSLRIFWRISIIFLRK